MKNELTLYHYWRSSCSWRVRWALAVKRIPYQAIAINLLKGEQSSPEYLKKNPLGFVPCLMVNQNALGESMAILEWIEDSYPTPALLPSDPLGRARVRQLSMMIIAGIQPLQNLSVQKYYCPDDKKKAEDGRHWISRGFAAFEKSLDSKAQKFCYGEQLSFADLCLIPQCYNALRFELDLNLYPKIKSIYEHCRELDECKESEPKPENS